MKTVYKYPLVIEDYQILKIPSGAVILTVVLQNEILCLWALVDTDHPQANRTIRIAGTGHPIEDNAIYIGTFLILSNKLVFHVFELSTK